MDRGSVISRPSPRAVLFDLGGTLVHYYRKEEFGPILAEALAAVRREIGDPTERTWPELLQVASQQRERPDRRVTLLRDRLTALWGRELGVDLELHELALERAFLAPIFATARAENTAIGVLGRLHAAGLRLGLVSNTPWGSPRDLWIEELDRHGLTRFFGTIVFCVDVGYRKPDPAPFVAALESLGVSAEEAIFIGDDTSWDAEGARSVGLEVRLVSSECPLEAHCAEIIERRPRMR